MGNAIDMTGWRNGSLTVIKRVENDSRGFAMWLTRCDCGSEAIRRGIILRAQKNKGCYSCSAKARERKHGMTGEPEYYTWLGMIQRCTNPNSIGYKSYGAKGVKVCDRWRNSFEAFYEDMGPRPTPVYTLDRINPYGDYEPSNCRWAGWKTQIENKRANYKPPKT